MKLYTSASPKLSSQTQELIGAATTEEAILAIYDRLGESSGSGLPAPYVNEIENYKIIQGLSKTITVNGSFFTTDITIECAGLNILSVEFVNSHTLILSVTANATPGSYSVVFDNGSSTVVESAIEVLNIDEAIIDLRAGGTEFSDAAIQMRGGMSFNRTEEGMDFAGANPWTSWARFVGDNNAWVWERTEKKTLSWIFTNEANFMLGIGSFNTDETSNAQYYQGEILGYPTNSTNFYGFYGNNGTPGTGAANPDGSTFPNGSAVKKLVIEDNGEPGARYRLYTLSNFADKSSWTDNSNLIGEGTISNAMTADEEIIMPFAIPRADRPVKFLGFILE